MNQHGDYELDPFEKHGTIDLTEELGDDETARLRLWVIGLVILVAGGIGWAVWEWAGATSEPEAPVAAKPRPVVTAAETVEQEPADLPVLADSDGWTREVVAQLSEHPRLAAWLLNEDLVRRFVATVDNLAEGVSPRPHVRFLAPAGAFAVVESGDRLLIDPATYRRYDTLARVVGSLHVDGTAQFYRNVKPLLDEAYQELGYPDGDFDTVAVKALRLLLDTPVIAELEVEEFASSYKYADPHLEGLSDAQKHFLRLGSDNLSAMQTQVRRIAQRAGLIVQ